MSSSIMAAIQAARKAKEALSRDPLQDQIDLYNSQPLPEGIPDHIIKCTERKKLILQGPYFKVPTWASMPAFGDAHLEVLKEGILVGTWPLHKWPYVLIGKNPKVCEYVMEHPSTSGVHCAIVFHGEKRQFYVIDLSSNGTQLNGVKLVKGQPAPFAFESSIVVGGSTRSLVLKKTPISNAQQKRHEGKNANLTVANPLPAGPNNGAPVASTVTDNVFTPPPAPAAVTPPPVASAAVTSGAPPVASAVAAEPELVIKRHFRHLLLKHVEVSDPVSKAPRNKGEPITRSIEDAVELASSLRSVLVSKASSCDESLFIEYCQLYSECKTAKKGGDLGVIAKGDMEANFEGPAFRLVPGAVSAPVTTELGIHLIFRCPE